MKSTIEFIDEAKLKLKIESDNGIAIYLGLTRNAISQYRLNKRTIDDYTAARLGEILNIDSMIIISAANAEREKSEDRRQFWSNKYKELGGLAASVIIGMSLNFVTPYPAEASTALFTQSSHCILC
jgi:transcriptional regulator with XRE-family HTH domain